MLSNYFCSLRVIFRARVIPVYSGSGVSHRDRSTCDRSIAYNLQFVQGCLVRYVRNHTRGIFPGITRTGTSVSFVRPLHNTRGTGICPLKTNRVRGRVRVRVQHLFTYTPTRNFCEFCKTYRTRNFSWVLYDVHAGTRNFCERTLVCVDSSLCVVFTLSRSFYPAPPVRTPCPSRFLILES